MRRAFLPVLWCCLLALLASATPLTAQSTTGSIQGIVKDNQDAIVPGATVTVRSVLDQRLADPLTDGRQRRAIASSIMPLGSYELTVGAQRLLQVRARRHHALAEPGRGRRRFRYSRRRFRNAIRGDVPTRRS